MEQIKIILNEIKKRIFKKKFLSLLVFDELGLSEKSPTNCLKALHSKLEMSLNPKEQKQISFIGISNWRLDATKMNWIIFLVIPEFTIPDIKITVESIANSYNDEIYNTFSSEYLKLGDIYYNYKKSLEKDFSVKKDGDSNEDNTSSKSNTKVESNRKKSDEFILNYHGGRDLYNIIKIFSSEMLEKKHARRRRNKKFSIDKIFSKEFKWFGNRRKK